MKVCRVQRFRRRQAMFGMCTKYVSINDHPFHPFDEKKLKKKSYGAKKKLYAILKLFLIWVAKQNPMPFFFKNRF